MFSDKKIRGIILIEVGVTSQDRLHTLETEKNRKYNILANKLGSEHNCKTKIIPYVMTWDGIVTNFHRKYAKDIGLTDTIEACIQSIVLKKALESITFENRRESSEEDAVEDRRPATSI